MVTLVALSSSLYSWANCSDGICGLQEDFRIAQGLWELYFTISSSYYPSTDSSDRIAEDCNSILDCNGIWKICSDLLALHKWKVLERSLNLLICLTLQYRSEVWKGLGENDLMGAIPALHKDYVQEPIKLIVSINRLLWSTSSWIVLRLHK